MATYKLPNGEVTDSQQLYLKLWTELGSVIEALVPGAKLAEFDSNLSFNVPGRESRLVLDVWFVETLARTARPADGRKFRMSAVRTEKCKLCEKPVHTVGAGRTRLFCPECLVIHTKLRLAMKKEQS